MIEIINKVLVERYGYNTKLSEIIQTINFDQHIEIHKCDITVDFGYSFRGQAFKVINDEIIYKGTCYDDSCFAKDINGNLMWDYSLYKVFNILTIKSGVIQIYIFDPENKDKEEK